MFSRHKQVETTKLNLSQHGRRTKNADVGLSLHTRLSTDKNFILKMFSNLT